VKERMKVIMKESAPPSEDESGTLEEEDGGRQKRNALA
jgi:hypothetical protein